VSAVVVRGFGYHVTHLAEIPDRIVKPMKWVAEFNGVRSPVAGLCGREVRSVQPAVIIMQEGTSVTCRECKREMAYSGIGPRVKS
jgi:hypothetical protein